MTRWIKAGQRLAIYGRQTDERYWGQHWRRFDAKHWIEWARKDRRLLPVLLQHLPPSGKVLDAGCGLGQYVAILKEKGYDLEGIDASQEVIKQVRRAIPDLPVNVGDVLELPYPDRYFDAVLSIGVVEHFEEGPEKALIEAQRVLRKGGILLVAVPYYNWLRRLKGLLGFYRGKKRPGFYQYAFTGHEFNHILQRTGFTPVAVNPYNARKGFRDELTLFRILGRLISKVSAAKMESEITEASANRSTVSMANRLFGTLIESAVLRRLAGHMMLFVARKG